jgi:hypothetical protein
MPCLPRRARPTASGLGNLRAVCGQQMGVAVEPGPPQSPQAVSNEPGTGYQSTLTIRWNDGTVTTRPGQEP